MLPKVLLNFWISSAKTTQSWIHETNLIEQRLDLGEILVPDWAIFRFDVVLSLHHSWLKLILLHLVKLNPYFLLPELRPALQCTMAKIFMLFKNACLDKDMWCLAKIYFVFGLSDLKILDNHWLYTFYLVFGVSCHFTKLAQ